MKKNTTMKICLVASGGGHLRQIMQLEPFFRKHDYYIVTEDTPLAQSIAQNHRVRFVPHFAFGQRKLKSPWVFFLSGLKNFLFAFWILLQERPHVVISTGAGGAFATLFWGAVTFRKVIYIETIARVEKPSLFGSMARHFAHLCLVQWQDLVDAWPSAHYCNPLREHQDKIPPKKNRILVTIGTFVPFDRLIREVDRLCQKGLIHESVKAQIGYSSFRPQYIDSFSSCSYDELNQLMQESEIVICHGGSGSLLSALKAGCKVVAVPRLVEHGEVYDNHQLQIIRALESRGLIEAAYDPGEIHSALERARKRKPLRVETDPIEMIEQIELFLGLRPPSVEKLLPKSMPPSVLHICHHYPRTGGIERYVQAICQGIQKRYTVRVLACHDTIRSATNRLDGVSVTWAGTWLYLFRMSVSPMFIKHLSKAKADLLHFHMPNPLAVFAYFLARPKGDIIVTYHMDVVRQRILKYFYHPMAHWLLKRAKAIIVSSPNNLNTSETLQRHRDRCVVIPFGVNKQFESIPPNIRRRSDYLRRSYGDRIILFVGRITYYKGVSYLVEAMKQVEGNLLIVGEGPESESLLRKIRQSGLEKKVHFLGWIKDEELAACYAAAKVFVLPSVERTEAFGIVLLEAQAAGVPCVTTEIGTGTSYVNRHHETGFVVQPRSPGELADAISRLLDDQAMWQKMSIAARRNVEENYTLDRMLDETMKLYDKILQTSK